MNSNRQSLATQRLINAVRGIHGPAIGFQIHDDSKTHRLAGSQSSKRSAILAHRRRFATFSQMGVSKNGMTAMSVIVLLTSLTGCGSQAVQPGASPPTLTVPANRPSVAGQPESVEPVIQGKANDDLDSVPIVSASSILGANREPAGTYYKVQSGDSLSRIAEQYQISLKTLISENGLSTTTVLQPGQLIYIPERQD